MWLAWVLKKKWVVAYGEALKCPFAQGEGGL